MAHEILTAEAIRNAVDLYQSLPAATSFRGHTGYGLIVDQTENEIIASVASVRGIWKPMYLTINGGERRGRKTVTAAHIAAAVEQFEQYPLWAALRSTSGRGLRLDDAGMAELVNAHHATTSVSFEVTHYGGSSLVVLLNVRLGKLAAGEIEWQSGFFYHAPGNKPMRVGEELMLTRFLAKDDFASDGTLARVWEDIAREVSRLTLLHTDGTLPKSYEERRSDFRVALTQELTALVSGVHLEKEQDFDYRVPGDKVVEVQMFLGRDDVRDELSFSAVCETFRKECNRVYMLYCQPLSERQKGLLGRPSAVKGFATTPQIEWQAQRENRERAIGFHPNAQGGNAIFSADGWNPRRGAKHRVYCIRKGRGFTGYPAPAIYEERLAQKDQQTAVRQLVRIEFDGREKVLVDSEEIHLGEKQQMQESSYWSSRFELMEDGQWWIAQMRTSQWQTLREVVIDDHNHHDVNGKYAKKIEWRCMLNEPCSAERRFQPDRIWVEMNGYQGGNAREDDLARLNPSKALYGYKFKAHGTDPEGKDVEVALKPVKNQYYVLWEEIPLKQKMEFLTRHDADWPLCCCMMQRRNADRALCSFCLNHRNCNRCGKDQYFGEQAIAKADAGEGALYCGSCKSWSQAIAIVDAKIPQSAREQIAADAGRLLAGEMIEGEEQAQERIAEALKRRYRYDHERSSKLRELRDCRSVVITGDGDWATRYAREDLERFAAIHEQSEDELMVTVATLLDPRFSSAHARSNKAQRFAYAAQSVFANLQGGHVPNLKLAHFVAESEAAIQDIARAVADAEAALGGFRETLAYLPDTDNRVKKVVEAKSALENKDFAKAKELAEAAQQSIAEGMAMIAAGEIMPYLRIDISTKSRTHTDVFAIGRDGSIVEPIEAGKQNGAYVYHNLPHSVLVIAHSHDNYGYQYTERWEVHCLPANISEAQVMTLRRVQEETRHYFAGSGTGWDVRHVGTVTFSTAYHRDFQRDDPELAMLDTEMRSQLPIDIALWEQSAGDDGRVIVGPYRRRSKEAKAVKAAEDTELDARGWLMTLEQDREQAQATYAAAEEAWVARDKVKDGSRPVEDSTVFLVPAFAQEKTRDREDVVFGPFFDPASGTQVKLVLDPFSGESRRTAEQDKNLLVRVRARNREQVHLFEAFLRPQAGAHKEKTFGYFVIPIRSPKDFDREIAQAEEQHKVAEQALERAKHAADYIAAKKRRQQEEVRTVAEEPATIHRDTSGITLSPLAEALRKAGLA